MREEVGASLRDGHGDGVSWEEGQDLGCGQNELGLGGELDSHFAAKLDLRARSRELAWVLTWSANRGTPRARPS